MNNSERLSKLLRERARNDEKEKLKKMYFELYNLELKDCMFLSEEDSIRLKREGYQEVFKREGTIIKDFDMVKNLFECFLERINNQTLILFHLDHLNCGLRVPFKIIKEKVVNSKDSLLADLLLIDEKFNYCICVEVGEHDYIITQWGING